MPYATARTSPGRAIRCWRRRAASDLKGSSPSAPTAPYQPRRSRNWLKVKCTRRQEFVIGGYRASDKQGRPFASLLLGEHADGKLDYRGRVGTGFDRRPWRTSPHASPGWHANDALRRCPARAGQGARWLTPQLVAEVGFTELTDDGHVRHAAFLGLREDKEAEAVKLETDEPSRKGGRTAKAASRAAGASGRTGGDDEVLGVRITHPGRILFADQGGPSSTSPEYYAVVADRMLQYAANQPVSLVRCPQGPPGRASSRSTPTRVCRKQIREIPIGRKHGGNENYLYVHNAAGLVAAVQMELSNSISGARRPQRSKSPTA